MKRILALTIVSLFIVPVALTQSIRTSDTLWFSTNNSTGEPKLTTLSLANGESTDLYVWLKVASGGGHDVGGIYLPVFYYQPAESLLRAGSSGAGKWSGNTGGPSGISTDTSLNVFAPFASWGYRALYDSTYSALADSSELLLAFAQSVAPGSGWNGRTAVAKIHLTAPGEGTSTLTTMRHLLSSGARNSPGISNAAGSLSWAPVVVPLVVSAPLSSVSLTTLASWNMLSVPVTVSDYNKSTLFPAAESRAFTYQGSYIVQTTLENGAGYWLKFDSARGVTLSGFGRSRDTIDVVKGWNMIGSISSAVAVASIASIPGGIATSPFFGFGGTYMVTDSIRPGQAYWVKVSQNGKLVVAGSFAEPSNLIRINPGSELPPPPPGEDAAQAPASLPTSFMLHQNYPNPFNPTTQIQYDLAEESRVVLKIFNLFGQEVKTLVNGVEGAGYKTVSFNAANLSSGIYYYRLQAGTFTDTKKLLLVR